MRSSLPKQWAVRPYAPDYGIDGSIEVFGEPNTDGEAETLGELFLFQLRSRVSCGIRTLRVRGRMNIEKYPLTPTAMGDATIEVIPFRIRTDDLMTFEGMGTGTAVVLFLVCLDSQRVFFVCLTDLIEKVTTPEDPNWRNKESKILMVPLRNEVALTHASHVQLRFYSARTKLLGLFNKLHYQSVELTYASEDYEEVLRLGAHFREVLLRLEVWDLPSWAGLQLYKNELVRLPDGTHNLPSEAATRVILGLWKRMSVLGRTYEEMCREWLLPTYLAHLSSYPPGR